MSLCLHPAPELTTTTSFCGARVAPDSIYGLWHRECHRLFPDEMFADWFCDVGRRSVPPMIVAVVMVLQQIEGSSDLRAGTIAEHGATEGPHPSRRHQQVSQDRRAPHARRSKKIGVERTLGRGGPGVGSGELRPALVRACLPGWITPGRDRHRRLSLCPPSTTRRFGERRVEWVGSPG